MDLVDRLFRKLRESAGRQFPASATPVFTVAELYQQLVPYRGVRGELGILELAEYEHALLRLLSGERGYLRVELPHVQEELRKELGSPNPILGIYRDYAAVRVELSPEAESPTIPERTLAAERPTVPERPALAERPTVPEPPRSAPARRPAAPAGGAPLPSACRECRAPLPAEEELRFCPHCGADQLETPCAGCGFVLRSEWNFCIRCGTPRAGARPGR